MGLPVPSVPESVAEPVVAVKSSVRLVSVGISSMLKSPCMETTSFTALRATAVSVTPVEGAVSASEIPTTSTPPSERAVHISELAVSGVRPRLSTYL